MKMIKKKKKDGITMASRINLNLYLSKKKKKWQVEAVWYNNI